MHVFSALPWLGGSFTGRDDPAKEAIQRETGWCPFSEMRSVWHWQIFPDLAMYWQCSAQVGNLGQVLLRVTLVCLGALAPALIAVSHSP